MNDANNIALNSRAVFMRVLEKRLAEHGFIDSLRVVKALNKKADNEGLSLIYFSWPDDVGCIVVTPAAMNSGPVILSELVAEELYQCALKISNSEIFNKLIYKKSIV